MSTYKTTFHSRVAVLTPRHHSKGGAQQAAEVVALTEESEFKSYPKFRGCFAAQWFKIELVKKSEKPVLECRFESLFYKLEHWAR